MAFPASGHPGMECQYAALSVVVVLTLKFGAKLNVAGRLARELWEPGKVILRARQPSID